MPRHPPYSLKPSSVSNTPPMKSIHAALREWQLKTSSDVSLSSRSTQREREREQSKTNQTPSHHSHRIYRERNCLNSISFSLSLSTLHSLQYIYIINIDEALKKICNRFFFLPAMECVGARNYLAAMAVYKCPTWRPRRKRQRL